jgi:hypothetical protein
MTKSFALAGGVRTRADPAISVDAARAIHLPNLRLAPSTPAFE